MQLLLGGCHPPPQPDLNHTMEGEPVWPHLRPAGPDYTYPPSASIPTPFEPLAPPVPPVTEEEVTEPLFNIVVTGGNARELLFALARDAGLNVDIDPRIEGEVTITAVEETLPRILDRIARQIDLRYQIDGRRLLIEPDRPLLRIYDVPYLAVERGLKGNVGVATRIATTGSSIDGGTSASGGDNDSASLLTIESSHRFWERLTEALELLLTGSGGGSVIPNPEAGVVAVVATQRQQRDIERYLEQTITSANRQVLIEATVIEVELNDGYEGGIDWEWLLRGSNGMLQIGQANGAGRASGSPFLSATLNTGSGSSIGLAMRLLEQSGRLRVLSSPRLLVTNNQAAMLKVVDNRVYFTTSVDEEVNDLGEVRRRNYQTTVHTLPVGLVIGVVAQIASDRSVTLHIRPTISRILRFVPDPSPPLADAGVSSMIPEIQIREMESMLRIANGEVAVLGGLMQEWSDEQSEGTPWLGEMPLFGPLFSYRSNSGRKSELVILIRPQVVEAG
jgi:MSHA type pilus biogenesis protein MshL